MNTNDAPNGSQGASVKLTKDGLEATASDHSLRTIIDSFRPRAALKRDILAVLAEPLAHKLLRGDNLTPLEQAIVSDIFRKELCKYVRVQNLLEKAQEMAGDYSLTMPPRIEAHTARRGERSSARGPSEAWVEAWESHAASVSEEQLSDLFARLLLGESLQPGTYSRRTIAVLHTLDQETASTFARLRNHIVNERYLPWENQHQRFFDTIDLSVDDLFLMAEAGLLAFGESRHLQWTLPFHEGVSYCVYGSLVVRKAGTRNPLTMRVVSLTRVGRELVNVPSFVPDQAFLHLLASEETGSRVTASWALLPADEPEFDLESLDYVAISSASGGTHARSD